MKIETLVLGDVRTNCYLLINEKTLETIVVDPADRADVIVRKAVDEGLTRRRNRSCSLIRRRICQSCSLAYRLR